MNKKRQLFLFSFHDRTRIEKHLEKMAKNGWMLEKVGDFFWHYHRIEPQDLHFSISYFPDATEFDPYPSEKQEILRDFCEHAGWKFVASSAQMEIYCNEAENPVPIETDARTELDVIHKAAKKSVLPTHASLLLISLINIWNNVRSYMDDPLNSLLSNSALFWDLLLYYWPWHAQKGLPIILFGTAGLNAP